MPGVVCPLVPAFGAEPQRLVVSFLVLLDESFQADVTTDFQALMVAQEQEEEPGNSAIAVAEWVDAKEIQIEGSQGNQRVDRPLLQDLVPAPDKFAHGSWRIAGPHGAKADRAATIGEDLDDVVVRLFVFSRIAQTATGQGMKLAHGVLGNRQPSSVRMDEVKSIAVAAHFLLIAVTECGLAKDDGTDAGLVHLDTFDPVRRHGALDQGMFAEHLEFLR